VDALALDRMVAERLIEYVEFPPTSRQVSVLHRGASERSEAVGCD